MSPERMTIAEFRKNVPKKAKYGNKKTEYQGFIYDSRKEAGYARRLEYLKHAHELKDRVVRIERQVPFPIYVGKHRKVIATYYADFRVTYADLHQEVIDVKSEATKKLPVYRLKKKAVEEIYQVLIIEK